MKFIVHQTSNFIIYYQFFGLNPGAKVRLLSHHIGCIMKIFRKRCFGRFKRYALLVTDIWRYELMITSPFSLVPHSHYCDCYRIFFYGSSSLLRGWVTDFLFWIPTYWTPLIYNRVHFEVVLIICIFVDVTAGKSNNAKGMVIGMYNFSSMRKDHWVFGKQLISGG